jgi:hypothetical protein
MNSALSLRTGHLVLAVKADYDTSRRLILICPECKEPVHLRRRVTRATTAYFAHSEYKGNPDLEVCSLRVLGYWDQPYQNSGPWSSRGQLVEKIQVELISYFADQFGIEKDTVLRFVKEKANEQSDLTATQSTILESLTDAMPAEIFKKIRNMANLTDDEGREISSQYNIVIACLQTRQLRKASYGLLWCSLIAASSLSDQYENDPDPHSGATCGNQRCDLALDPLKFKKIISSKSSFPKSKKLPFYRCVSISQRILIRLLINWKNQSALKNTHFIRLFSTPKIDAKIAPATEAVDSTKGPPFGSLKERNRWLSQREWTAANFESAHSRNTPTNSVPRTQPARSTVRTANEAAADAKSVAHWNRLWGKNRPP